MCARESPGVCLCVFKSDLNNYKFQLYENQRQHTASNMTPYGNGIDGAGGRARGGTVHGGRNIYRTMAQSCTERKTAVSKRIRVL